MERVYLALGANLGERAQALTRAASLLELRGAVSDTRMSHVYETEPLDPGRTSQPWYLNAVLEGSSALAPEPLLAEIHAVEAALGRAPDHPRWSPREIDIDILLFGDRVLRMPSLTIPHPGLTKRRFVLAPLAEIAPDLVVPGTGMTVAQHLSALHDPLRVILYAGSPPEERA